MENNNPDKDKIIDPERLQQEASRRMKNLKMKKSLKWGIPGIIVILLALLLVGGAYYEINEEEQAVVITFGSPKAVTETGLHFKVPVLQSVEKVNTTIQGFPIGYELDSDANIPSESVMITADYNFINIDFFVEYRISDPVAYLYASEEPIEILKNVAQSSIRTVVGSYNVDDVLTTGKSEIQSKIKTMVTSKLEEQNIGVMLVNISMQDSEPPTEEIKQAFKAVENAKQGKETALNNANKYRNEKLPEAQAEADEIIQDAEAQKQTRINEATAQVARFSAMYEEYSKNPVVTKQRMFYEAMEEVLPGMKVIISDGDQMQTLLPLDSFTGESDTSDAQQNLSEEGASNNEN